jgi:hypothetical protein
MTTTMKKLTKTQREVLEEAARKSKGRVGVHAWTRESGRFGGKGSSGGQRKLTAILSLVEMGALDSLKIDHHSGRLPLGELTIYSTEAAATITDAGRELLASTR